jgi:hypothetical protein
VLVFKTEKVPNESSEDFEWRKNRRYQIAADDFVLRQQERQDPHEAEQSVFDDGKVVECLWGDENVRDLDDFGGLALTEEEYTISSRNSVLSPAFLSNKPQSICNRMKPSHHFNETPSKYSPSNPMSAHRTS